MEKSVIKILNRNIPKNIKNKLDKHSDKINEMIAFGAKILAWDLGKKGDDADLPAILFLRNLLENADAIGILIRHSSIEPCKILLRTALENYCSIEYLIQEPEKSKERSLCFMVWNFVEHGKWLIKTDKNSKEFLELKENFLKDKLMITNYPLILENAKTLISRLDDLLATAPYKLIKEEYDLKASKKRNPAWYSLFGGPDSLRALAYKVKLPALYEVLYRGWSHSSHGNNIVQGKLKKDSSGMLDIEPLRTPDDADSIAQHCTNLVIAAFLNYVSNRLPERKPELLQFYENHKGYKLPLNK